MRYTIRTKLILSYLLIVFVALTVSGGLFYALAKDSVQQRALNSLEDEGKVFMDAIQNESKTDQGVDAARNPTREVRMGAYVAAQSVRTNYVLINQNQVIVQTNVLAFQLRERLPLPVGKMVVGESFKQTFTFKNQKYLVYATPVPAHPGLILVLLEPLQLVRDVLVDLIGQLLRGFVITSIVVLALGVWLSRSLTKPVLMLREQMKRLAKRDFSPPPIVQTGDEYELLSRQFASLVEELQRYDQGQRRFLQNASHELKTPLMSIQGYAEGIKDGIFQGEEAHSGLEVISKESMRLKKLVDELIYLSKLETLEDVYNQSEQEFTEIVRDSLERVKSLALQKSIELRLQAPGSYRIRVDRDKMMQAMINLLSNGIRHARSLVEIELQQQGDKLLVLIRDDGEGFSGPEEAIFERFYKGDKGDTGLGLAIVKAIVQKSGGTIRAQNSVRGGAEFQMELPLL